MRGLLLQGRCPTRCVLLLLLVPTAHVCILVLVELGFAHVECGRELLLQSFRLGLLFFALQADAVIAQLVTESAEKAVELRRRRSRTCWAKTVLLEVLRKLCCNIYQLVALLASLCCPLCAQLADLHLALLRICHSRLVGSHGPSHLLAAPADTIVGLCKPPFCCIQALVERQALAVASPFVRRLRTQHVHGRWVGTDLLELVCLLLQSLSLRLCRHVLCIAWLPSLLLAATVATSSPSPSRSRSGSLALVLLLLSCRLLVRALLVLLLLLSSSLCLLGTSLHLSTANPASQRGPCRRSLCTKTRRSRRCQESR